MASRAALVFLLSALGGAALTWLGPPPPIRFVDTICPSQDVPAGIPLDDARFRPCSFPRAFVDPEAISSIEPTRTLDRAVKKGVPVLRSWLGPPRTIVDKNLRSTPVMLLRREAFAPFLEVGDWVDVLWVSTDQVTHAPFVLHLIQRVRVADVVPSGADQVMVALNVGSEEAELLASAQRNGRLVLTLRNPDDLDVVEERGMATVATLLSNERHRILQQKRFNGPFCIRGASADAAPVVPLGPPRPTRCY